VAVGVIVGAALSASVTLAASVGSGTVNACYKAHSGALRLLTHGTCRRGEKAISWSQVGPTGPAGATGSSGATGAGATTAVLAYAEVNAGTSPTLMSGRSSGFQSVSLNATTKAYCLVPVSGISPATTTAVVAPIYFSAYAGSSEFAYLVSPTDSSCPSGDFEALTFGTSTTPVTSLDFSIAVY
jgi:hypothetical protein